MVRSVKPPEVPIFQSSALIQLKEILATPVGIRLSFLPTTHTTATFMVARLASTKGPPSLQRRSPLTLEAALTDSAQMDTALPRNKPHLIMAYAQLSRGIETRIQHDSRLSVSEKGCVALTKPSLATI